MPSNNQKMTYEERCQHLVDARAKLAAKRAAVAAPDESILADLGLVPKLTYVEIAYRNKTSLIRICKLAKANGLNRYKRSE